MAIAPLNATRDAAGLDESGLRLVRGGRPTGAGPRGSARHAATERTEALRRSRAAHPTARPRTGPVVLPASRLTAGASRRGLVGPLATRELDPAVRTSSRTSSRAATPARRRRTAGLGTAVVALVLLAMPLHALGAVTLDGRPTPGGVPAGLDPGSVYVVQSGDSIASIAQRVNPSQAATIERELVASTGSRAVVPGEHVVIP